jgi:uroporphyrinogen decarboxylase
MNVDFERKDKLTPRERMRRLIAGEPVDRVPFNASASGFAARVCGIDRGTYYRNPERAFQAGLSFIKAYPWTNSSPRYGWADRGAWEFGGSIVWPDNDALAAPRSFGPVITHPTEVDSLPDPDPETAGMMPLLSRFNELLRERGLPAALPVATPTNLSAAIAGGTNFWRWIIRYPDAVHKLQRKVTDFLLRAAEITIGKYGAGSCGAHCGLPMESNMLMSPKTFERFSKPYIKEILGYYLDKGIGSITIHLCGNHTGNLVHWKDIPLPPRTVFSIGHEMDLEATARFIGKDHILAGNISTSLLQAGSYEEVFEDTARCLKAGMEHPGGYVLMPACELPPNTPLGNVEAVAHALFEHGYY